MSTYTSTYVVGIVTESSFGHEKPILSEQRSPTRTRSNPNTSPYLDYSIVLPCIYKLWQFREQQFALISRAILLLKIDPGSQEDS